MLPLIRRVIPNVDEKTKVIAKYSQHKPGLRWGDNDRDRVGIYGSGWNPLRGINICFRDESVTKNRMWFVIELPAPGITMTGASVVMAPCIPLVYNYMKSNTVAIGYFFDRNPETGKVDLFYRLKPFKGKNHSTKSLCRYLPINILTK